MSQKTFQSALEITPADIQKHNTVETSRDAIAGIGTDETNLRNLQSEVDIWEAKAAVYTGQGRSVPREIQVQLDAKLGSLNWQRQQWEDGKGEKRDFDVADAANSDVNMLTSARDTDMAAAVRREVQTQAKRGFRISEMEAMGIVEKRIDTEGVAAVLPQYARIAGRMGGQLETPEAAPRVRSSGYQFGEKPSQGPAFAPGKEPQIEAPASEVSPIQIQARSDIMKLTAANKADLAAGRPANPANYKKIEALRQYA